MKTQKVLNGRLCAEERKKNEQNNNMETVSVVDVGWREGGKAESVGPRPVYRVE